MSEKVFPQDAMRKFDREKLGAETPIWKRIRSETINNCRVFQVRRDWSVDPRDGREHDFFCIEAPDWINIIPLTAQNEVVMIEQYRHGTNEVTLETPGGMIDEGEEASVTAVRELFEETGYIAPRKIELLGRSRPNPALQNNWLYTFLARDVEFKRAPTFESTEHTAVRLVPLQNVRALINDGTIDHALVMVSFYWLWLKHKDE